MSDPTELLGLEVEEAGDSRWSGYTDEISGDAVHQLQEAGFEVSIEPAIKHQPQVEASLRVVVEEDGSSGWARLGDVLGECMDCESDIEYGEWHIQVRSTSDRVPHDTGTRVMSGDRPELERLCIDCSNRESDEFPEVDDEA